jgi:hypothetical protein
VSERAIPTPALGRQRRVRRFRVAALLVIAIAVGVILWLVLRDKGGSSTPSSASNATAVSVSQIQTLATSVGHPVFWVGRKAGYTYELTRTSNGSIFIRYLPQGVQVGAKKAYLTVATYPFPGAFAAIKAASKQSGSTPITIANNGLAEISGRDPSSVHVAYPGVDYQIEVFDPTGGVATSLVAGGKLAAFGSLSGSSATPQATAASPADIKSLAKSLGHPIYWAGPENGYIYELSKTASGLVYIRYLPPGTKVGAPGQYLTVGTYPFTKAFAAIQALAKQPNAETINLAGGGLAVVDKLHPKSIHLAYPGSGYQVEVFDRSPAQARQVVSAGKVTSIG